MRKTKLYIDIDDTILAACYPNSGMDFRPVVLTQVEYLSRLFNTYWLTHWNQRDLLELLDSIYSKGRLDRVNYAHWRDIDPFDKAPYILENGSDFYWLEDPLSAGDLSELVVAGVENRYIPVEPVGMWGFTRACRVLFSDASIGQKDLEMIEAPKHLFNEPCADHFDFTYYE